MLEEAAEDMADVEEEEEEEEEEAINRTRVDTLPLDNF